MAIETKTTVKSYFEAGDRPTETQFDTLIDSYVQHPRTTGFLEVRSTASSTSRPVDTLLAIATAGAGGNTGILEIQSTAAVTAHTSAGTINVTIAVSGATARSLGNRFLDTVSVEDFGAAGDGSTDDSTAFTNAIATGRPIVLDGSKTYVLKDVTVSANRVIFGNGARLNPASGAKYLFRMSGFRPELHEIEIEDANDVVTVSTTLSGAEAAGQTALSITSETGFEVGQLAMVEMNVQTGHQGIPRWHLSPITAVAAGQITIERALEASAASGNAVKGSWGLINVKDANRYVLDGIAGVNTSNGIYLDSDVDNGDSASVRGVLNNIQLMSVRNFGIFAGRDVADTVYTAIRCQGGNNVVDDYTGDGSTTDFDTTTPVWRKSHLTVKVDDVTQTEGTDYTFSDNDTISFTAAPATDAAIELTHGERCFVCFMMDSTGFVDIRGGDQVSQIACLGGLRGIALHTKELTTFDAVISDTISGEALLIDDASEQIEFGTADFSFCHQPIKVDGSSITSLTIGGAFRTKFATASDLASGAVATEAINIGSGSRLRVNAAGWTDDSNFTYAGDGELIISGSDQLFSADENTVAAGSTVFFGPQGHSSTSGVQSFVVPRRTVFVKLIAQVGGAPGAGESFTYTLQNGGTDTAITGSITETGTFGVTITGSVAADEGDTLAVELVTSGGAAAVRHRMVLVGV